ncbi:hypothetical protein GNP84_06420 [Aliivibrio fischeri]|uniref:hypothetical protein n=1 Tax=Aliivibrio fischeri TaxID=668 RepID=UPI0012D8C470|nr:hypothetical protein [Aliivibrio fischeri]MUK76539.1 hypothetical protein [Aliivibrio fischeri]
MSSIKKLQQLNKILRSLQRDLELRNMKLIEAKPVIRKAREAFGVDTCEVIEDLLNEAYCMRTFTKTELVIKKILNRSSALIQESKEAHKQAKPVQKIEDGS